MLLHWAFEDPRLSKTHRGIIDEATPQTPLYVSDMTLWEIATLYSLRRIELEVPLRDFLERVTAPPLVERLSISPTIAAEVAALPDSFHRDPRRPRDRRVGAGFRCGFAHPRPPHHRGRLGADAELNKPGPGKSTHERTL